MKTLKCDLCEHTAAGESFEAWMMALKPHYQQAHADVMNKKSGSPEEMKTEMMKWMTDNKTRFDTEATEAE